MHYDFQKVTLCQFKCNWINEGQKIKSDELKQNKKLAKNHWNSKIKLAFWNTAYIQTRDQWTPSTSNTNHPPKAPLKFWIQGCWMQWCRNRGDQGGHRYPPYLADQLTLFQPGRAYYPHLLILATPMFFTFRHHWNVIDCLFFMFSFRNPQTPVRRGAKSPSVTPIPGPLLFIVHPLSSCSLKSGLN